MAEASAASQTSTESTPDSLIMLASRFAFHILVGSLLFVGIGFVAVQLHHFVGWMEKQELEPWMNVAAKQVVRGLFGLDLLGYALLLLRTGVGLLTHIWKARV